MYTYLRNVGPLFFMEFSFPQKFESLIVSLMALFALAYSSHILWPWPIGRACPSPFFLKGCQFCPIVSKKGNRGASSARCFWLPPSLIMPPSIQIMFGDEDMWKKVWLFTRSCFHAEFLEFQSYSTNRNHFDIDSKQNSFWQNSSDSYGEVFRNDGKFLFLFWWKYGEHEVTSGWS